jgi:tRNA/tmRNA/rRNA uracil-C5-methylase (TrmA/RlmC/RlmD family)
VSGTGDILDLDITGVAHGGVFVARHEGRVVFVPDAIPGERVRVRLTDTGKTSFWRAETLEVLDASPHRQLHVWRQADVDVPPEQRPGGADFGHISLEHQRRLKLEVLLDALHRFGGIEEPAATISAAAAPPLDAEGGLPVGHEPDGIEPDGETVDGTGWRTRVSLHVDADGNVGQYAARSHRVIPLEDLPLATAAVERAALGLRGGEPGRIDLVQPGDGRVRVLPRPQTSRRQASRPAASRPAASRDGRGRPAPARRGRSADKAPIQEVVVERVGGRDFRVDAGGFWQVHRLAAHTLTTTVAAALRDHAGDAPAVDPDAWHLDLYGGVGLFAATLGELGGPSTRVTSVESEPRATEHVGENLAAWVGARAETARVDRWLARLAAEASATEKERLSRGVVLLDPPRSGAGREVVEHITALSPATVVYVACDPVALARDIATFRSGGYEVGRIDALDVFPNSHHVEAVAVLTRE